MRTAVHPPGRDVEAVLVALGDPSRRRIFFALMEGERSVSQLAEPLAISLTGLGQHIKILEAARLVSTRKVGRARLCAIDPSGLASLEQFAKLQRELWQSRFSALRKIVEAP